MKNRLASEKSPYLLQHARNPVDWYPWGDEAFAKARAENKPLFLSVGYSTCHWCHVMAHESFENPAIADVLNSHFVPVKVDREERPDVDRVYMLFVQATTGGGGWPMSVWLTPELEPFYGGTYFPPAARWGRPGFIDILQEIARAWRDQPDNVRRSGATLAAQLKQLAATSREARPMSRDAAEAALDAALSEFRQAFDPRDGGFGAAPKFPRPSEIFFLLREFARRRSYGTAGPPAGERDGESARDMALTTLRAMARGGICDHVGGGFHRYSVDARWHVPHFEKMLYDQAQLALAYLEAFQVTGDVEFQQVASAILAYVSRDLRHPGGAFYSAEDADSVPHEAAGGADAHAVEGAFYLWTDAEFGEQLGENAGIARLRYGVRPDGNVESDPHGELRGKNVLYLARSVEDVATTARKRKDDVSGRLAAATSRLFEVRAKRPRPGLDDKVIVAWNGLMIAAFARAARVLRMSSAAQAAFPSASGPPPLTPGDCLDRARAAAAFIHDELWDAADGRLLRRFRDGDAAIEAYADDFACLIFGLVELFQADGDPRWLEWAIELQRRQDALFWDGAGGGWFSTSGRDPSVLLQMKEDYDGAEPAASSVSAWNLLALARLTAGQEWSGRLERTLDAFAGQMQRSPRAMPMMMAALSAFLAPKQEIVVVGEEGSVDTEQMLAALASRYLPFAVAVQLPTDRQSSVGRLLPFAEAMKMRDGRATAYVCREFACRQPVTDAAGMLEEIDAAF